jgi:hypothetical protein
MNKLRANETKSLASPSRRSAGLRLAFIALSLSVAFTAASPVTALAAPSAATGSASSAHHTTAVLNGHLDPDTDPGIVGCRFDWGTTNAYGNSAPCDQGNSFVSAANVTATLGGLTSGATYHFRLTVETTSNGTLSGSDQTLTTVPFPISRPLIASFGPDGTSASSFQESLYLTMNRQNRRLYVLDRKLSGIYGFDASSPLSYPTLGGFAPFNVPGPPGDQPDIAVDSTALPSSGNIYYVSENQALGYVVYGYNSSGAALSGFPVTTSSRHACGAAVDSEGHLWLANHGGSNDDNSSVEEFTASGAEVGSVQLGKNPRAACKVAFDSNDDLYVAGQNGPLWKYTAASDYASGTVVIADTGDPAKPASVDSMAVDPITHDVYADIYRGNARYPYGSRIDEYNSAGEFLGEFAEGEGLGFPNITRGIAVDPVTHYVYTTSAKKVLVYGDEFIDETATVTTKPASEVVVTSARLNGAVDPEGLAIADCHIEWGTDQRYDNSVPCDTTPSGSGDVPVSAPISGLSSGTTYHYRVFATTSAGRLATGEDEEFTTHFPPSVKTPLVSALTDSAADLNALINPKEADTSYRFEWGTSLAYGHDVPVPDGEIPSGTADVPVTTHLSGLAPNTTYHWRISAQSAYGTATGPDSSFTTLGPAIVETTGSPLRTTETAELDGRVDPRSAPTTFHFEYGPAPCDANPCQSTPNRSAGSGSEVKLVAEQIEGLTPATIYHYRLVADNGKPGASDVGADMTVRTRGSDAPLSHGHFPGPPGSDRAYEQVSIPDSGGNPVVAAGQLATAFSINGDRAIYAVNGGTPISESGTSFAGTLLFAERTPNGWQSRQFTPPRSELLSPPEWGIRATNDLSYVLGENTSASSSDAAVWGLPTGGSPNQLFRSISPQGRLGTFIPGLSADGSRALVQVGGGVVDPAYPETGSADNLYDVSTGTPHLASVLPGDIPACIKGELPPPATPWISADGSRLFFSSHGDALDCTGTNQLYVRNLQTETSAWMSGPAISGPTCDAYLLRTTEEAAFFWTAGRLTSADTSASSCGSESDGDVYRYELSNGSLECLTCVVEGADADVNFSGSGNIPAGQIVRQIAIAPDGSRIYFKSNAHLLPGTPSSGFAIYRLDVASGSLAYVGPVEASDGTGESGEGANAIGPDGSVYIFRSADPGLNPIGSADNGGLPQYYRYDDHDRSLVCVSCPSDGAPASASVPNAFSGDDLGRVPLSDDGSTFAFATPTPLVGSDQNTPKAGTKEPTSGTDIYEWRDGRVLLVTDGLTSWPALGGDSTETPVVSGLTPNGRDLFFTAPIQYTADALDAYRRLYDARIGGGFEFPPPPRPCPLEVCQGTPKGVPEEAGPGTSAFAGPGNQPARTTGRCARGKLRRHGRCIAKHGKERNNKHRRANRNRRAHR